MANDPLKNILFPKPEPPPAPEPELKSNSLGDGGAGFTIEEQLKYDAEAKNDRDPMGTFLMKVRSN